MPGSFPGMDPYCAAEALRLPANGKVVQAAEDDQQCATLLATIP